MAYYGEQQDCTVVAINPRDVAIQLDNLTGPTSYMLMVNGSVQSVPVDCREVGVKGRVMWARCGCYHGWIWAGKRED